MLIVCDQPHEHWYEYIINIYGSKSLHDSKHLFDIYSLTHLFWLLLFMIIFGNIFPQHKKSVLIVLFIISIAFEIHENSPSQIKKFYQIEKDNRADSNYKGDSLINMVGDILFSLIGLILGYNLSLVTNIIILIITFIFIINDIGIIYFKEFLTFLFS